MSKILKLKSDRWSCWFPCLRTLKAEYTFSQVNPRSSSLRQLAVTLIGAERFAEANAGQQPAVAVTARGIMILP